MRRTPLAALVTVLVAPVVTLALAAAPASAITNGSPDGGGHPNVGGLVADHAYSDGTWLYCSGTLISPTVFLTAAHCAEGGGDRVRVTFSSASTDGDATFAGTVHADPLYDQAQSDFTSVGYGAYEVTTTQGAGGHTFVYDDVRGVATGTLNATNPAWLRISMNPSTGNGGTCYGDAGGPNFLGTSNVVAATTITGDSVCRSTNVDYRLDTASARGFLSAYVRLP